MEVVVTPSIRPPPVHTPTVSINYHPGPRLTTRVTLRPVHSNLKSSSVWTHPSWMIELRYYHFERFRAKGVNALLVLPSSSIGYYSFSLDFMGRIPSRDSYNQENQKLDVFIRNSLVSTLVVIINWLTFPTPSSVSTEVIKPIHSVSLISFVSKHPLSITRCLNYTTSWGSSGRPSLSSLGIPATFDVYRHAQVVTCSEDRFPTRGRLYV